MSMHRLYWLFTLLVAVGLMLPILAMQGMFVDGTTYAAISNNLANGRGSFWSPMYGQVIHNHFYDHPPLAFGLQSLFFWAFGDGAWVEKFYSVFTMIVTAFGIVKLWRLFNHGNKPNEGNWLPVLVWLTIPIVFWSYQNNLLENTMAIFTTFGTYYFIKAWQKGLIHYIALGSFCTLLAFLCKGPVGLFPLCVPVVCGAVLNSKTLKKTISYNGLALLFFGGFSLLLITLNPNAFNNLKTYWDIQVMSSLNGNREVNVDNRFYIPILLLLELAIPIAVMLLFYFFNWNKVRVSQLRLKSVLMFFAVGLTASLPLMISLKQGRFYVLPSMPFFALSFAFMFQVLGKNIAINLSQKKRLITTYIIMSAIIVIGVLSYSLKDDFLRDKEMLSDVLILKETIAEGNIVGVTEQNITNWPLIAYLVRFGFISIDKDRDYDYMILNKRDKWDNSKYVELEVKLNKYILITKRPS